MMECWSNGVLYSAIASLQYSNTPIYPALHLLPLTRNFVKENRCGGADVQRIHRWRHGNGDRFVTGLQNRRGNSTAFAAEDDAAIAGEIGAGDGFVLEFKL